MRRAGQNLPGLRGHGSHHLRPPHRRLHASQDAPHRLRSHGPQRLGQRNREEVRRVHSRRRGGRHLQPRNRRRSARQGSGRLRAHGPLRHGRSRNHQEGQGRKRRRHPSLPALRLLPRPRSPRGHFQGSASAHLSQLRPHLHGQSPAVPERSEAAHSAVRPS